jgi:hypothetical protein
MNYVLSHEIYLTVVDMLFTYIRERHDLDEDVAHGDSQVLAHSHQLGCQHLTACKFRSKYPSISATYFLCLELSK